jgi:hypothetical protein
MVRGSKPGEHRGGRKKGTPNRTSASVKAALLLAYDAIGGDAEFAAWAKANRTEFYRLYAKLLPTEIKNADGEPFELRITRVVVDRADSPQDV